MPTYDYRCEKCGVFEIVHKMSDDDKTKCPTCGSQIEKLISSSRMPTSGVIVKDKGYYHPFSKKKDARNHKAMMKQMKDQNEN